MGSGIMGSFVGLMAKLRGSDTQFLHLECDADGNLGVAAAPVAKAVNTIFISSGPFDNTSDHQLIVGQAGKRIYITSILAQNSDDTVDTWVYFREDVGDRLLCAMFAAHGGGGASVSYPTPIPLPVGAGLYTVNGTTSAEVRVSVTGFVGA